MKRIFITGICGFIGKALANRLIELGYAVDGVDNLSIGKKEGLHPDIGFHEMSIDHGEYYQESGDSGFPKMLATKYDAIFHLASWKIPRERNNVSKFLLSNTRGTMAVVEHAKRCGAKLFFASTSDIYGKQTNFNENADSILGPTKISRWSYAITKLWSEHLMYATEGLRFNIIRYFNVYGIGQSLKKVTATPMAIFTEQAFKKEPFTLHGNGSQKRCFAYIDDIVASTVKLLESDYDREVFNIGNPNDEISMKDLGVTVWELINPGIPYEISYIPYTDDMEYEDVQSRVPDIRKAQKLLGLEIGTGLDEGLKKTIEWHKQIREKERGENAE